MALAPPQPALSMAQQINETLEAHDPTQCKSRKLSHAIAVCNLCKLVKFVLFVPKETAMMIDMEYSKKKLHSYFQDPMMK